MGLLTSSGKVGSSTLGSLSAKYESRGGVGTVANNRGDIGGASYGTYQISTNTGTMKSFLSYLKSANPSYYKELSKYSAGSTGFNNAWKSIAKKDPNGFNQLQHAFVQKNNYAPAANKVKSMLGIDVTKRSNALQQVMWSVGTQHGAGGALNLFRNANVNQSMTDAEIIRRVYEERMKVDKYFSSSSAAIKKSVLNRFKQELQDALAML